MVEFQRRTRPPRTFRVACDWRAPAAGKTAIDVAYIPGQHVMATRPGFDRVFFLMRVPSIFSCSRSPIPRFGRKRRTLSC